MSTDTNSNISIKILVLLVSLALIGQVSCGGSGGTEGTVETEKTQKSTVSVNSATATPASTSTATPVPTATATPVPTATATPASTSTATPVPTATATPAPTATATPVPTATATPVPIPTLPPLQNRYLGQGFIITLNPEFDFGLSEVSSSGMNQELADESQGIISFEYSGAEVIMYWLATSGDDLISRLETVYLLLKDSQPENNFYALSNEDILVDNEPGKSGGYLVTSENGDSEGGGLIGIWTCTNQDTDFTAIVNSSDATVVQIRFERLRAGFECK